LRGGVVNRRNCVVNTTLACCRQTLLSSRRPKSHNKEGPLDDCWPQLATTVISIGNIRPATRKCGEIAFILHESFSSCPCNKFFFGVSSFY